MDVNPLCVILVKNGSRGDRLLFRYPYSVETAAETKSRNNRPTPYSAVSDGGSPVPSQTSILATGKLVGFSDKVMSNLFAVKSELSDRKFELKVNDVRFVGHPVRLSPPRPQSRPQDKRKPSTIILFNIVFALKATLSHDVVNCYQDLSLRLGMALRHEEYRCQFLSVEARIMLTAHDEASQLPEDGQVSPFQLILERSQLARHLRDAYQQVCGSGLVQLHLNNWIEVSFCLPQKVHRNLATGLPIDCEGLLQRLRSLKPYHTFLLLEDREQLLGSLSPDASQALWRLLHVDDSHLTPFFTLAADADLTLTQVFMLVSHLVYWGKATVIYPVCSSNTYVLSPNTPTHKNSPLVEEFRQQFPDLCLHQVLADFSLPTSLSDKCCPFNSPVQQQEQVGQVVWLLKRGLLQQLHTYVYLAPPPPSNPSGGRRSGSSRDLLGGGLGGAGGSQGSPPAGVVTPQPPSMPLSHTVLPSNPSQATLGRGQQVAPAADLPREPLQQAAVQLSQPPSESDLGSVCSDERSPSPGTAVGAVVAEDVVVRQLDAALSLTEKDMVMKLEAAKSPEDLKLFARVCGYFRGQHHLEEIMYCANLRRSQLLHLIDKFRPVLFTCQHPDPLLHP